MSIFNKSLFYQLLLITYEIFSSHIRFPIVLLIGLMMGGISLSSNPLWADTSEGFLEISTLYKISQQTDSSIINVAIDQQKPLLLSSSESIGGSLGIGIGFNEILAGSIQVSYARSIDGNLVLSKDCLPVSNIVANPSITMKSIPKRCRQRNLQLEYKFHEVLSGIRYQPYDHWSPLLSFHLGLAHHQSTRSQELIMIKDQWYRGRRLVDQEEWSLIARTEFAVLWRWHSHYSVSFGGFIDYQSLEHQSIAYGIRLWVSVYRYLKFW
jgi:hypothetical protein